jgi:hypothetical protein
MRNVEVDRLTRLLNDTMRQRDEAADEIERLKKALYAIAHYEENTDADYCEWYHALLNIARAALEEEK